MVVINECVYLYQITNNMKLELSPKQADLLIDLLSNKAVDLTNTLKNLDNAWGIYGDVELELMRTLNLHSAISELHSRAVK